MTNRIRSAISLPTAALLLGLAVAVLPPVESASAASSTHVFTPVADTYVTSGAPSSSYGSSGSLYVDASSVKQSFLRFSVTGLEGRTVSSVKLRLYQRDSSPIGGTVHRISSNSWNEATTWNSRPAIDGPSLATFGSVSAGSWYEVELGAGAVSSDGTISLAIQSPNSDGARWASREGSNDPQLLITSSLSAPTPIDGVSQVLPPSEGSSDPTYHPSNHRLIVTSPGRLLTVVGRHSTGVQLMWKDPGGEWSRSTQGATADGLIENNGVSGDRPASIAITTDQQGNEQAWVAWSGASSTSTVGVYLRRLSNLDSPSGPTVGPLVTVAAVGQGNSKVDLQFERDASGVSRGVLSWLQRTSTSTWDLKTAWFTDLASPTPAIRDVVTMFSSSSGSRTATLVPSLDGMRLVAKGASARLTVYQHSLGAPLSVWSKGIDGATLSSASSISAVALSNGEIVAVSESDTTNDVVSVYRITRSGDAVATLSQSAGYREPTVATDGSRIWVVMVRTSDGAVVSRLYSPSAGWSGDRVEIGSGSATSFSWPNAVRTTDGRLRLVVGGTPGGTNKRAVLAFQRLI